MKRVIVDWVQGALKRPPLEHALQEAYRRAPRGARRYLRKLAPQPSTYLQEERRSFERGGLQWHFQPYAYFQWLQYFAFEDPVLEVLFGLARHCQVILDIGANVGFYSLLMAQAAGKDSARVLAFEPNPETFALLCRHRDENRVTCCEPHQVALGDRVEQRTLFARRDLGKFSLIETSRHSREGAIQVEVTTLDAFAASTSLPRIDLIKIDVEGHEPAVLLGAKETIARDLPCLCFELTPPSLSGQPVQPDDVFRWLTALPYRFFVIALPEAPTPRLTPLDLMAELQRGSGRRQLNVVAIPSGKLPVDALVAELNALRPGHPERTLLGHQRS
jgi:FkbM family methyltransferase